MNDSITKEASDDFENCPILQTAALIARILKYPITYKDLPKTPINTYYSNGIFYQIPSIIVLETIRHIVGSIGIKKLGFGPEGVGTHSNRSAGAMAMFLCKTPIHTIMLIGRWSSDAFLRYIRKQVLECSTGISKRMLLHENFYTVPDFVHTTTDGALRTRNNNSLATTASFSGIHANMRHGLHPAFSLEH
jgi:hypothetical protein